MNEETNEKKPWSFCDIASIPELGIEFQSVHTKTYHKYFSYFRNDNSEHIYELTARCNSGIWEVAASSDGNVKFSLCADSKHIALGCALAAMRRYLVRGHRAAWRTLRRQKEAAKEMQDAGKV